MADTRNDVEMATIGKKYQGLPSEQSHQEDSALETNKYSDGYEEGDADEEDLDDTDEEEKERDETREEIAEATQEYDKQLREMYS